MNRKTKITSMLLLCLLGTQTLAAPKGMLINWEL